MNSTLQNLNIAIAHHQAGRLDEAESIYKATLDSEAAHPDALHLLGVLLKQRGDLAGAIDLIGRALALRPSFPEARFNYGMAMAAAGRSTDALAHLRLAHTLRPDMEPARDAVMALRAQIPAAVYSQTDRSSLRRASFVCSPFFNRNGFFSTSPDIRDNALAPYIALKEAFRFCGIDLSTSDINPPAESEFSIYLDIHEPLPEPSAAKRSFLIMCEPPTVLQYNWDRSLHTRFDRIFTYDDSLVDGGRYIKWLPPNPFPETALQFRTEEKTKFCVMIVGAKSSSYPGELYSERLRVIRWFEKHQPQRFDLYGHRWPKEHFPSYRGSPTHKREVMGDYRFSICYENMAGLPGYVTEKIFDSFFNGVVPVYWGAPNIEEYVPESCFIDRRRFRSNDELYEYLAAMSDDIHQSYLDNIARFIERERNGRFGISAFVRSVLRETLPLAA